MMNVLIAEDNAAYRQSLNQTLRGRFPFMQITESADGDDALHQVLARHYDLIFMDIRLPQGNGLDLTRAIKAVFEDSVVCVITSYDILEYREAAIRNGADHFLVKGDTTEAEVVSLVDSLLRTRFTTLIIVSDTLPRKQLNMLLSLRWPAMIVAEAMDADTGRGQLAALKPNLVLLELGLPDVSVTDLARDIRLQIPTVTLIGMTDGLLQACRATAIDHGVDYCVPLAPMGHTELVTIVSAMRMQGAQH